MFRSTLTQSTTNFQRLHQNVLHKALLMTPTSSGAMMMLSGNYTTHIRALSGMSASSSSESSSITGGKSVPSSVSFSTSSRHVRGVISSSTTSKNHHHHPFRSTPPTTPRPSFPSSSSIARFTPTTPPRINVIQSIPLKNDLTNRRKKVTTRKPSIQ